MIISTKRFAGYLFMLLLFLSLALPSGHLPHGLNIKIVIFGGGVAFTLFGGLRVGAKFAFFALLIAVFLDIETVSGIMQSGNVQLPLLELKSLAVTVAIPGMTYLLVRNGVISPRNVFLVIVCSTVAIAFGKIGLLVYAAVERVNFIALTRSVGSLFHDQIMTMHIAGPLYRFQVPADLGAPIATYIVLMGERLGIDAFARKRVAWPLLSLILLTGFLAYSRYTWVFIAAVMVMTLARSKTSRQWFLIVAPVLIFSLSVMAPRFFSPGTAVSDNIRLEQLPVLMAQFETRPWFGHGLGFYVAHSVSDKYNPFSYELQWVAILMQVGLGGLMVFLTLLWSLVRYFSLLPLKPMTVELLMLFAFWVFSGMFSPNLVSSAAGVIFSFFVAAGFQLRENRAQPHELNLSPNRLATQNG